MAPLKMPFPLLSEGVQVPLGNGFPMIASNKSILSFEQIETLVSSGILPNPE